MTFTISELARQLKYKTWLHNRALSMNTEHESILSEEMPPNIRKVKERIQRLSEDREKFYKDASK